MKRPWRLRILAAMYVLVTLFLFGLMVDRRPAEEPVVPALALPTLRTPGDGAGSGGTIGDPAARSGADSRPRSWMELFRPSPQTARILLGRAVPLFWALDGQAEASMMVYGGGRAQAQGLFETIFPFLAGSGSGFLRPVPALTGAGPAVPVGDAVPMEREPPHETAAGGLGAFLPPGVGEGGLPGTGATAGSPGDAGATSPPASGTAKPDLVRKDVPLVGIYHTHEYESYVSEFPGKSFPTRASLSEVASANNDRNIVRVGKELALALPERGIGTVHVSSANSRKKGYDRAYEVSLETARDILRKNPSVQILLDIHRDDTPRPESTVTVGGLPVARVALVIGRGDKEPQPHWEQNLAFARDLGQAMDQRYPGLLRGVIVKPAFYNQHLLPGALLLEIGSATNTMDEARRSADLLSGVLADMIRAGRYPYKSK